MPTIALADLRSKVYARLDGNTSLYGTAEVDYCINEAVRVVALFTGFYRITIQVPGYSVANQLAYATPPEILVPSIIYFEGRQLQRLSLKALARARRTWATDTTATRGRMEYWAPIGVNQFVVTPKDAQGGRDFTITGMGEPPLLALVGDVMPIENEYVELITEYAAHRLPLKEGGKIFADGSLALNEFYSKMRERRQYEALKFPVYKLVDAKPQAVPPPQEAA